MAFSENETKRVIETTQTLIERIRPPQHIRDKVDMIYRLEEQSLIFAEMRPHWRDADRWIELPFAKISYIRTQNIWRLFWFRASGKWQRYDPGSDFDSLEAAFAVVQADDHHCFFG